MAGRESSSLQKLFEDLIEKNEDLPHGTFLMIIEGFRWR